VSLVKVDIADLKVSADSDVVINSVGEESEL